INPGLIVPNTAIKPLFSVAVAPVLAPHPHCAPPCGCAGGLHVHLGGFAIGGCTHHYIWIAPVTRVIEFQVWAAQATIEVWVEDVIGVYIDAHEIEHQILVAPAGWRTVVIPGHFEIHERTEVVVAGHWIL
ncbi:MAG: hypothetical protein HRU14_06940, partial [Planctomycetes bacterium]|nr:hypothetical protein [Planctomycetota bacterium]